MAHQNMFQAVGRTTAATLGSLDDGEEGLSVTVPKALCQVREIL
jgi:hypothetical protein